MLRGFYYRVDLSVFPRNDLVRVYADPFGSTLSRWLLSRRRLLGPFSVGTSLPQSQQYRCGWWETGVVGGSHRRNGATQEKAKTFNLTPQTTPIRTYRCIMYRAPTPMDRFQ